MRVGHHCARPLHERFGIQSSTRASFYLYTTRAEIDELFGQDIGGLVEGLTKLAKLLPAALTVPLGRGVKWIELAAR